MLDAPEQIAQDDEGAEREEHRAERASDVEQLQRQHRGQRADDQRELRLDAERQAGDAQSRNGAERPQQEREDFRHWRPALLLTQRTIVTESSPPASFPDNFTLFLYVIRPYTRRQ